MNLRPVLATAAAICALTVTACSSADAGPPRRSGATPTHSTTPTHGTPTPAPCKIRAGARCPGPAPVDSALIGQLYLASRTQLAIYGDFQCGGQLRATESTQLVTITYVASRVRTGAMTCAKVNLSVRLAEPLDGRRVIDGVTGERLPVGVLANSSQPAQPSGIDSTLPAAPRIGERGSAMSAQVGRTARSGPPDWRRAGRSPRVPDPIRNREAPRCGPA
jgi:hypothetical protein